MNHQPAVHLACISLGSNLGDKPGHIRTGLSEIAALTGTSITARSRLYQTEPVGYREQDWFLNAAIQIRTHLSAEDLMKALQEIEHRAGRRRGCIRFGPRTLDLDILLYDDLVMETPHLIIPHPRMHERHFVLQPLCDIDPAMMHPVLGRSVAQLIRGIDISGQQLQVYGGI